MIATLLVAAVTANVINGLNSERTGTVYPASARTEILKQTDSLRIVVESAIAPEGFSRRVLAAEDEPSPCVGVDDCVYFACGGKKFFVNDNGAWCGDRPDGFSLKTARTNNLWRCTCELPLSFCGGGDLTIGRRFAYGGERYGRDASIRLDPKTFGDPNFIPPIEDSTIDPTVDPFRKDDSVAERLFCQFAYYPRYHRFRARCDVGKLPRWQEAARQVDCLISDAKCGEVLRRTLSVSDGGIADETFDIPDLKARTAKVGDPKYELTLSVRGVRGAVYEKNFYRHICEWEDNKYGLSGIVVPPFTPVTREKVGGESRSTEELEKVSVILRDHIVDKKTGLWKQVTAAGKELLARPMRLVAARPESAPYRADDAAMVGGDLRAPRGFSTSTFNLQPSTFNQSTSSTWDYDGLMEWKLTLRPGHYEPMDLEIPFKAAESRLMNACVDNIRCNYCGFVPKGEGSVWNGKMAKGRSGLLGDYVPYIWIGGPVRGIAVFGENDKGWVTAFNTKTTPKDDPSLPPCQEIVREKDGTVTLRLHLIQKACDLTAPQTIRIGFQATPVKPMHPDFRRPPRTCFLGSCNQWGAGPADSATESWDGTDTFFRKMAEARRTGIVDLAYVSNCVERMIYPGLPGSKEWTDRKNRLRAFMTSGMRCAQSVKKRPELKLLWYMNGRGVVFGNKSGATFADQWSREEFLTMDRDFVPMSHRDYELDPDKDFQDYSAWWYRLMLTAGAMDYLYWDDTYASPNWDLVGTDAYRLPDGRIQPATGLFNMRAFIKRAACVQAELGCESRWNWIHETNAATAPVSAFVGVHYDWEDNTRGMSFQKRYPKDYMQAGVIGRQFGVLVHVIGYYGCPETQEKVDWFKRTGAGWCIAHELGWSNAKKQYKLLEDWGYRKADTRVWNYWDEDVAFPVATKGLDVATLAMARPDGEALLVVSNAEDKDGEVVLKPDAKTLGIKKGFSAVDLETGKELVVSGGKVKLELKGDDYAIVVLK